MCVVQAPCTRVPCACMQVIRLRALLHGTWHDRSAGHTPEGCGRAVTSSLAVLQVGEAGGCSAAACVHVVCLPQHVVHCVVVAVHTCRLDRVAAGGGWNDGCVVVFYGHFAIQLPHAAGAYAPAVAAPYLACLPPVVCSASVWVCRGADVGGTAVCACARRAVLVQHGLHDGAAGLAVRGVVTQAFCGTVHRLGNRAHGGCGCARCAALGSRVTRVDVQGA